MNRKILTAALLGASIRAALAADPAALSVVVFDQGRPVPRTEVWIDGSVAGRTDRDGAVLLNVPAGSRELILRSDGRDVLRLDLDFAEGERAELIASLQTDAPAQVQYESSEAGRPTVAVDSAAAADARPPGTIAGRVVSGDGGVPVANARVFLSGTALDLRTDAEGRFSADLPPGTYSMSVIAANYDTRSFEGIALESEQTLERSIELTPAGIELPEFVVLEPYVEGSLAAFVEEKRTSAQVLDLLGAEQISRTGDSDAAGALKRVTGLTLVDGRFIYIRGLGERYSSVLLNGAQIPSPDPTRRVVPLDLFPTEVLEGIGVQKTYSADMPGEFAGGTVQLRTRSYPDSLQIKAQLSGKYADGATGSKGDRYSSGNRDWTGRDRSSRNRPEEFDSGVMPARNSAEMAALATGIAAQGYNTEEQTLDPGTGLSASIGNSFGDTVRFGFTAAFRYQHDWDHREEFRRFYTPGTGDTQVVEAEFDVATTTRSIDGSGFLSTGVSFGDDHALRGTWMLLRQTTDRVQNRLGFDQGADQVQRRILLEWIENALVTQQVSGEHRFPMLSNLKIDWQYTNSRAQRLLPNLRSYRLQRNQTGDFFFQNSGANLNHRWERLDDTATEYRVDLELPVVFSDRLSSAWQIGAGKLERDRESRIDRLRFCSSNQRTGPLVEDVINPGTVGAVATPSSPCLPFYVENQSQREDYYLADQVLNWAYLGVDLNLADRHRLNIGLRREEIDQLVLNRPLANPNALPQTGELDESDDLLGLTYTWAYSDKAQVRAAYSETLSRPEFREKARSTYIDPVLDISVIGNLDVVQTAIKNYDLRWEYYFSATETFSVALFGKQFDKPIELVRVAGTGDLLEVKNADSADLYGIEVDYYQGLGFVESWRWVANSFLHRLPWDKLTVGLNYARIESEVSLGENIGIQTTDNRPLQFQSPYVVNFQLGFDHPGWGTEASLLFNQFGRRLFQVGVSGQNDIYEEPNGQLDFVLNQRLSDDWKFKLRLRNLLDPTLRYKQGDDTAREFRKGREVSVALEWSW